jgi:hypothetical protein
MQPMEKQRIDAALRKLLPVAAGALIALATSAASAVPAAPDAPAAAAEAPAAHAESVDEVIARHLQARGGKDRIKAIRSARMTGRISLHQGMEAPFTWEWKRPNSLRLEFTIQGITCIQAYDGATGWMVMPFMGKRDPEAMSDSDLKRFADAADLDGALMDYREKGHQVELAGKEAIEGTDAYKLKLTRKNGDVSFLYLDAQSYLQIKEIGTISVGGEQQAFESGWGDYKEAGGVMFPFAKERKLQGQTQVITIEKIELNVDTPAARFKMPAMPAARPAAAAPPPG